MRVLSLALLALLAVGCGAEIGDECNSNADCGQRRFCDRASRGGYCTITPCTPNSCPENSVCVEFENEETYCMALCDTSDDCRTGYTCDQETGAAPYCRQTR
ncbi:MAG: hypothetical protein KC620_19590 [Myxococcales bacterium]|nr:hypothetical protein [Myxococcales bacterium]